MWFYITLRSELNVFEVAERIAFKHVFHHPFVALGGRHFPAGIAGRYYFNNRCTLTVESVLECFLDSSFSLAYGTGVCTA